MWPEGVGTVTYLQSLLGGTTLELTLSPCPPPHPCINRLERIGFWAIPPFHSAREFLVPFCGAQKYGSVPFAVSLFHYREEEEGV